MMTEETNERPGRTPSAYTDEDRTSAIERLNDEARLVMEIRDASVLLDLAVSTAYILARKGQLPGAFKVGDHWKVNRPMLKDFLYAAN